MASKGTAFADLVRRTPHADGRALPLVRRQRRGSSPVLRDHHSGFIDRERAPIQGRHAWRPGGLGAHAQFKLGGRDYLASNGGPHDKFNDSVSLSVDCKDQAEVDRLWDGLTAEGGKPVQCGWLKDKCGPSWQIVPQRFVELLADPDPEKGRRVTETAMKMVKLDIAALEAAAAGG